MHLPLKSMILALLGNPQALIAWTVKPQQKFEKEETNMAIWKQKRNEQLCETVGVSEAILEPKENKKRRKPQDRTKLIRNRQVQIRLTEQEVSALKSAAKESEMTLADFVMSGVHQTRRIVVPGAGELRMEILRMGNNLNQALRLAHALRKEGKLIDIFSIEHAADRIEDALEKLQNWLIKWDVHITNKKGENADCEMRSKQSNSQ